MPTSIVVFNHIKRLFHAKDGEQNAHRLNVFVGSNFVKLQFFTAEALFGKSKQTSEEVSDEIHKFRPCACRCTLVMIIFTRGHVIKLGIRCSILAGKLIALGCAAKLTGLGIFCVC